MFDLSRVSDDPILGLTEAYKADPASNKVNLGVGVYKNNAGQTPVMQAVKAAEQKIIDTEASKAYIGIAGDARFTALTQHLLFGQTNSVISQKRAATVQTPGGTGALRVAADFIKGGSPNSSIWLPTPTWANHGAIFQSAGIQTKSYPYYRPQHQDLDKEGMLEQLNQIPAGDIVLLHACCHNPSGVDPDQDTWKQISTIAAQKNWFPLIDFAYQGLGDGLQEDRACINYFIESGSSFLIASSFSKNFGLYNERTGALTLVAENEELAQNNLGHIKKRIRSNYSNPPSHGASIVVTILDDNVLYQQWFDELNEVRSRIKSMRMALTNGLNQRQSQRDFSFINTQKGMFSFSGLTKEQVYTLRNNHHIYIVDSGRINVAALTDSNIDTVCDAIVSVI